MPRMGCYVRSSSAPFSLVAWLLSDRSRSEEVDVHVRGGGVKVVKKRLVEGCRWEHRWKEMGRRRCGIGCRANNVCVVNKNKGK